MLRWKVARFSINMLLFIELDINMYNNLHNWRNKQQSQVIGNWVLVHNPSSLAVHLGEWKMIKKIRARLEGKCTGIIITKYVNRAQFFVTSIGQICWREYVALKKFMFLQKRPLLSSTLAFLLSLDDICSFLFPLLVSTVAV